MKLVLTIPLKQLQMPLNALNDVFIGFVLVYSKQSLKVYKQIKQ